MGEKHQNIQWKDLNSTSSSSYFTERYFTHRLGGSLGRDENWDMDLAGEKDAHKQTGTSCIKTSPGMLFKSTGNKVTAYSDDLTYFLKMEGTKNLQIVCLSKQIW